MRSRVNRHGSSSLKKGITPIRVLRGAGVSGRKKRRLAAHESWGRMLGGGWTRACSCPTKQCDVETHSVTFLLTADPLALICGLLLLFFICFSNSENRAVSPARWAPPHCSRQTAFRRPGRRHLGQHPHFSTWGHHPLLGAACHVYVCSVLQ